MLSRSVAHAFVLSLVGGPALACQARDPGQDETSGGSTGAEGSAGTETSGETGDSGCPQGHVHEGDLEIGDATTSEDVSCIEEVTGSVVVRETQTLGDLLLLGSLRVVRGDFVLDHNVALVQVEGLGGLEEIHGSLFVSGNPVLVDLSALDGLSRIGGMDIAANPALEKLPLLAGPIEIVDGTDPGAQVVLAFVLNDALVDFDAFGGAVPSAPGGVLVGVYDHANLSSLAGLSSFATLGAALDLEIMAQGPGLGGLPTLGELPVLEAEVGNVVLVNLPAVTSLEALAQLTNARRLRLQGLGVTDLQGFESLQSVDELWIGDCNPASEPLARLTGLENLNTIGSLFLVGNSELSNITALAPTQLTSQLWITDNPALPPADAQALATAYPDADATVCGNQGEPACEKCPPQGG